MDCLDAPQSHYGLDIFPHLYSGSAHLPWPVRTDSASSIVFGLVQFLRRWGCSSETIVGIEYLLFGPIDFLNFNRQRCSSRCNGGYQDFSRMPLSCEKSSWTDSIRFATIFLYSRSWASFLRVFLSNRLLSTWSQYLGMVIVYQQACTDNYWPITEHIIWYLDILVIHYLSQFCRRSRWVSSFSEASCRFSSDNWLTNISLAQVVIVLCSLIRSSAAKIRNN